MSEQDLREYTDYVKQLLKEDRADEALQHAQFLLRRFPRYWLGYRLLGEALLEQGHFRQSIEVFRYVLSVDPENLVAHAGLAAAYAEEENLEQALWHMMRAFEGGPGIREIRDQLRHLYKMRDGRAPGRLHLTRAALARAQIREGLYEQAVDALRAELESEPDRIDLLSALAEAQWYAGHRQAAVQTASEVLRESPSSLKSNLLLGEFYAAEGDFDRAERYLRIAQQLDPPNELAFSMFGDGGSLEPRRVPLDWRAGLARATRTAIAGFHPDWRPELYRVTARALQEWYERQRHSPHEVAVAERVERSATDWRAGLRTATEEMLGQYIEERGIAREAIPTESIEPLTIPDPTWKSRLHAETETALAHSRPVTDVPLADDIARAAPLHKAIPEATPVRPPRGASVAATEWVANLHAETESAIHSVEPAVSELAPSLAPDWVARLHAETEDALVATTEKERTFRERLVESTQDLLHRAQKVTEAIKRKATTPTLKEVERPDLSVLSSWAARLREETEAVLKSRGEEETPSLPDQLIEGAGDLLRQAQEAAEAIKDVAADSLTSKPEEEPSSREIRAEETEVVWENTIAELTEEWAEPPIEEPVDELSRARQAWQAGESKEAYGIYHRLFLAREVEDEALSVEVAEWCATGDAPALAHQLLGDLYRRMGRLQDAVAQYRQAINRM